MSILRMLIFFVFSQISLIANAEELKSRSSAADSIRAEQYNREGILAGRLGDFEKVRDYLA